mgnify:CR=1 FL=1
MGLLNNTDNSYYSDTSEHGNYQFVSLNDIVSQFMFAYVGEGKVISKTNKLEVSFHAQRALAEMSFDVFKSVKALQIDLPPSLSMVLPRDYVSYTKVSFVDGSGIKHRIYPTSDTSNPFQVLQADDKSYSFPSNAEVVKNNIFNAGNGLGIDPWVQSNPIVGTSNNLLAGANGDGKGSKTTVVSEALNFRHSSHLTSGKLHGANLSVWQKINVDGLDILDISARASTVASAAFTWTVDANNRWVLQNSGAVVPGYGTQTPANFQAGDTFAMTAPSTTVRIGISTSPGDSNSSYNSTNGNIDTENWINGDGEQGKAVLQWTDGVNNSEVKDLSNIDVSSYTEVYVKITSTAPWETHSVGEPNETFVTTNTIDQVSVINAQASEYIQQVGVDSSTFNNYKSRTPSENRTNDDYEDDIYWPNEGERYGLDPARAQVNGSFYIDDRQGKINFSSNISGKTVILDYISDSLGTDKEMQVHKFAEEAMYKSIMYGLLSVKSNVPEMVVRRYKKERFSAVRQAKLRLSSIKLGEITQILRGKSKQIKH